MKSLWAAVGLLGAAALAAAAQPAGVKPPSNEDCLTCHGEADAKRDNGRSVFVPKKKLAASVHGAAGLSCVDCHADLASVKDFPHAAKLKPVLCASCHDTAPAAHPFHPGTGAPAGTKTSAAAEIPCADCHGSHDVVPVKDAAFRFAPARSPEACGSCHTDERSQLASSEHGKAAARGAAAPDCVSCHRAAVTASGDPDALARKRAQERLCVSCHLKSGVTPAGPARKGFIASYEASVHGQALRHGEPRAANCVDCHGAHEIRHGFDSSAPVHKMHVGEVCGRCHEAEGRQYAASVHGTALTKKGNRDAPACTDCHGEHGILSPKNPASPVAARNVSAQVCTPCHASVRLAQKWNLPRDRAQTFADSYHGLAARGGSLEVANCASCHGVHDILPSADPASRIFPARLSKTCGTSNCHPGANARFAKGKVHVSASETEQPLLYWISTLYVLLIVSVVGGMLLHNLLDFVRKSKRQLAIRRGEETEIPAGRALYLRMTLNERIQHGALTVSFVLLAVTGFMLRYPDAWWVVSIRRVSSGTFELRSLVHRVAAVVLVAASLYHVVYVTATVRGRALIRDLWWKRRDFADVRATLRYNSGLSSVRPRYDRFSYIEKSEYWALVWGTIIMAVTGCVMWFDNTFIGLLTKVGYDASRLFHFYEAWLASLAILVWHVYFVVFNPDVYPMNASWLKGTLTEREMEEEHPLELERIREREKPSEPPATIP